MNGPQELAMALVERGVAFRLAGDRLIYLVRRGTISEQESKLIAAHKGHLLGLVRGEVDLLPPDHLRLVGGYLYLEKTHGLAAAFRQWDAARLWELSAETGRQRSYWANLYWEAWKTLIVA